MRNTVSCLVISVGLVTGASNAQGQRSGTIFTAEAPVTVPPSGVLVTQPPAPVAVPPSGVLVTQPPVPSVLKTQPPTDRHAVATMPIKTQTAKVLERNAPMATRRQRTVGRHVITRTLVKQDLDDVTTTAAGGASTVATQTAMAPPTSPPIYVPTPSPAYNWTGLHIGGNIGFGWNAGSFSDPLGNTLTPTTSSKFLGGGQVGFNYQFWRGVLIGADADFDWLPNESNLNSTSLLTGSTVSFTVNNRWLTTATGRFGYAWDRVLVYGKGGGAWVGLNNPTVTINGVPVAVSSSYGNSGWTAGLGVEWAFWGNWSARIEYDFVGLSSQTFTFPVSAGTLPAGDQFSGNNRNIQLVNVATNYKFDPWW
jgi:outer membrane immunogenic protein